MTRMYGGAPDEGNLVPRGILGMSSSLFAVGITLTQCEQILRVLGAGVGLAIGILTLISMLRKRK
jgi:uncharacterized membrane protein required for colicin V production